MKQRVPKTTEPQQPAARIPAGEFKARCLELMDQVRDRHAEIVITKYGKPVAKLVPFEEKPPAIFGLLKGTVIYHDDIVGPTGERWDADNDSH
ncbi:MAG: type II toxin-antitoxin system Phd/YefM family antitoxin [Acidobacteria bacterium]|nr:type II toxin-antitoxin system Phd/YefM family antitoxin [Acidobacteriota bacterium]